jgi:drug/metabolite transporter (DMT)-like permease
MHRVFEYIMEIIGWLQIVASPLLIGLGIAAFIYFPNPSETRLIIAIIVAVLGLVIGIVWANRIWKTKGTMWFVSQISATPDLDNFNEKETEKNEGSH